MKAAKISTKPLTKRFSIDNAELFLQLRGLSQRWVVALALIGLFITGQPVPAAENRLNVYCHGGRISFQAVDFSALTLLQKIQGRCNVEFEGADLITDRSVSISIRGESIESAFKRILIALGVRNFVLEYEAGVLKRVRIFQEAAPGLTSRKTGASAEKNQKQGRPSVVEVRQIVEGSQAESTGLKPGDWILAYGGVTVYTADQLKAETEKRSEYQSAEVEVFREGRRIRFYLDGGFIGVRIRTHKVTAEELKLLGK